MRLCPPTTTKLSRIISGSLTAPLTVCAVAAAAQVPTYTDFELQARSNIVDGYNLPTGSSFSSGTPAFNDAGDFAFRLIVDGSNGRAGLWFGGGGSGAIVYNAPSTSEIIVDPDVASDGRVLFEQSDFGGSDGLFIYDPATSQTVLVVPPGGPFNTVFFGSSRLIDDGSIGWRNRDGGSNYSFVALLDGQQVRYVAMVTIDPQSPYSFLFSPDFNNNRQFAAKARLGGAGQLGNDRPDHIRVWNADGSSTLIAEDQDSNPASIFRGFDNGVTMNDDGWVAFTADLGGGVRGVFLGDGQQTIEIATTADPDLSVIEFFRPAVNNHNLVAFRGRDGAGLDAVYVGDGNTLRRVVGRRDTVPTDLGPAWIDQHDNSLAFGGSVAINDRGDVAFNAALTPEGNNQIEWGSGMFIAYADPIGEVADIIDFDYIFGSHETGGIDELREVDDEHLVGRSQFGFSATEPNLLDLRIDFETTVSTPATLTLTFDGRLDNPGGMMQIRLRNWSAKQLDTIDAFGIGNSMINRTISGIDATEYVRPKDGRIRTRLRQSVVATFSASGFQSFTDRVQVVAE